MAENEQPSRDELLFLQLISMFQAAAMQQLGKIPNPVTNEVERSLEQAKISIDTLDVIKKRSEGRRTSMESEFLDKVLFELRMNYVDESKKQPDEDERAGTNAVEESDDTAGDPGSDTGRGAD